jgi:pre-mRNA-processing factor 17
MKYIADPTMHSMPAVTLAPNLKWLGCQSMDNKIVIYSALNRFKLNRKKTFKGHMVAGYACGLDFSPEMRYGFLQYLYIVDSCSSPLNCFSPFFLVT